MTRERAIYAAVGVALLCIGAAIGYVLPHHSSSSLLALASRTGGYEFVNPLLTCDLSEDQPYDGFSSLENAIHSEIDTLKANGDVTRMSVYFRDMNSGTWTGVNVDDKYIPASLMKVPLYMAYLKQSQTDTNLFSQIYTIPPGPSEDANQVFKPKDPLIPGMSYTVDQLIHAMIVGSDNNAEVVLTDNVATSSIDDVYQTLNLPAGQENDEDMSPKDYMVLFRVLYNATYIGRTRSRDALELMSNSEFTAGIVAGIPSTTVSHKFGERSVFEQDSQGDQTLLKRELHDCGIVYYPGSPYGLCVMTEGTDFTKMSQAIAAVSAVAYKSVSEGLLNQN